MRTNSAKETRQQIEQGGGAWAKFKKGSVSNIGGLHKKEG